MQITLKDLFVFVAFCAVVAWCGAMTGFNGFYFFAVVVMAGIGGVFISGTSQRPYSLKPVAVTLLAFFFSLTLYFSVAILAFCLFLIVSICALNTMHNATVRRSTYVALICGAAALVVGTLPGLARIRNVRELRIQYPIVSLRDRLPTNKARNTDDENSSHITAAITADLATFEDQLDDGDYRRWALRRIHDHEYERFVGSMGFGVIRMFAPTESHIKHTPIEEIPYHSSANLSASIQFWRSALFGKRENSIHQLHQTSRADFFDPAGFGAVFAPEPTVADFVPHAFHHPPTIGLDDPELFSIDRLELVSLLKFAEPRVYVLDHLPRMDQLSGDDVPTRPLDEFETAALEKLWTEQDIVTEEHDGRVRMLGSLRAAKQCLDCHSVDRGTLLGAFTYVIRQNKPAVPVGE